MALVVVSTISHGEASVLRRVSPRPVTDNACGCLQAAAPPGLAERVFATLSEKHKANFQAYMAGNIPE